MKIVTEVEITDQRVSDILCDAFEGGSNYWIAQIAYLYKGKLYEESKKLRAEIKKLGNFPLPIEEMEYPPYIWLSLIVGGEVLITAQDQENPVRADKNYSLNAGTLRAGMTTMAQKYPKHFADIINENDDAVTGDVFLQCCLFGEIIFS